MVWEPRLKSSNNLSSSKLETSDAMFSTQIMHQQAVKTDKLQTGMMTRYGKQQTSILRHSLYTVQRAAMSKLTRGLRVACWHLFHVVHKLHRK